MAIDSITTGEGGVIADAYGEHIVTGHLFYNGGAVPTMAVILGEGVWNEAVKVWYRGEPLTADQFHFHPGTQSASVSDAVQGIDSWLPGAIPYSTTAYLVARPPNVTIDELDPSQLTGRYKCRQVPDYDADGNPIGSGYSSNPARILIGLLVVGAKIAPTRIDWSSWYDWKVYCDTPIEWNDGKAVRQIKRFESHVPFTGGTSAVDVLNMLTDMSATFWQDDGVLIRFFPVASRSSVVTLTRSDIISGSFAHSPVDIRNQPTRLVINFRDLDSEFLAPAVWTSKDEAGIDERGVIDAGTYSFGAMHYSQAQRLAKYWLRRAAASERFTLDVSGEHMAILPGDLITVDYPAVLMSPVLCHVMAIEDSAEGADNRSLSLASWAASYSDQDHEPIPAAVTVA